MPDAVRDVAYYLRQFKFNEYDRRYGRTVRRTFCLRHRKESLDQVLQRSQTKSTFLFEGKSTYINSISTRYIAFGISVLLPLVQSIMSELKNLHWRYFSYSCVYQLIHFLPCNTPRRMCHHLPQSKLSSSVLIKVLPRLCDAHEFLISRSASAPPPCYPLICK